jgi:hypothetical protein
MLFNHPFLFAILTSIVSGPDRLLRGESDLLGELGLRLRGRRNLKAVRLDLVVELILDVVKELIVGTIVQGTVVLGADIAARIAFEDSVFDIVANAVGNLEGRGGEMGDCVCVSMGMNATPLTLTPFRKSMAMANTARWEVGRARVCRISLSGTM